MTTKIHAVVDSLGNPIRFLLTGGEVADCTQAPALLKSCPAQAVIGDKGYDSDTIVHQVEEMRAEVVIPPRSHRKQPRSYDTYLYGERYRIECEFGFMKQYRRIFSRFDKMKARFLSFIHFVGTLLWLR